MEQYKHSYKKSRACITQAKYSKKGMLVLFALCVLVIGSFSQTNDNKENFPALKGAYLGQQNPGNTPVLFAPGIVCTGMDDRDIAVSPDGKEIFYGVLEQPHYVLIWLKEMTGKWESHRIAPFSGSYNDYEPQFSPDGKRLYFCSDRPLSGKGDPKDSDIWFVERVGNGWSEAENLGAPINSKKNEYYPSITKTGTMYFTSQDMKICRSEFVNGAYSEPEILPEPININAEYNAFVDPDERYLIYTSHSWGYEAGRGDLFISFKKDNQIWTKPQHLGPLINTSAVEMSPTVSLDGKYLFFSSMRTSEVFDPNPVECYFELLQRAQRPKNKKHDIYWIDAGFIKEMKIKSQRDENDY